MIYEIISMNGYAEYVWTSFAFTLICFAVLYTVIKTQLVKEKKRFIIKFGNLSLQKVQTARKQETYKAILNYTSISKI